MHSENTISIVNQLDKVGIICSGACVGHCILTPIIALSSPLIASYFENEWIHISLLIFLVPVAIIAFSRGKRVHRKSRPLYLGSAGVTLLVLAVIFESLFKIEVRYLEAILTTVGCIFLFFAHFFNITYLKNNTLKKGVA